MNNPYCAAVLLSVSFAAGVALVRVAAAEPGHSHSSTEHKSADSGKPAPLQPYDPKAVTQTFIETVNGGVQRVVANETGDAQQIGLVRAALLKLADNFAGDDFSSASPALRADLPGLPALVAARPGELHIQYVEIRAGAEVRYTTASQPLIAALHEWFEAQQAPPRR